MKLSDYVVDFLAKEGMTHIFEIVGGAITHLLDSAHGRKDIVPISMHHEMAAAIAAEGYSRAGENIGVAMATSGPGATNLITGIGSCFFDSIPCIFITGQVNTYEGRAKPSIRQAGFQEMDIVSVIKPLTKDAIFVKDPDKIRYYLEKAIDTARSGRPGPVLLDIPMNIQRADIDPGSLEPFHKEPDADFFDKLNDSVVRQAAELINSSSRPIVLAGGGVRASKAQDELLRFIRKTGMPVAASLMGLDAFPGDDPLFAGMIGSYGNRYSNLAVANSDLLLALGTRLDTRQTGTRPGTFARGAKIIHVDIDPHELNNKVKADFPVKSDVKKFLTALNERVKACDKARMRSWTQMIKRFKDRYPSHVNSSGDVIEPNFFMHKLSKLIPDAAIICADVGQNQMWAAQSLEIKNTQRFLTQGGMGSMGSSLAMGIGASFARPGDPVVVISGDGGFQLNTQELQTLYHHNLPVKIIMLNNNCYGMVRQFQEQYFNSKFQSTVIGYSNPDFQGVVSAYKIDAMKISRAADIDGALKKLFSDMRPMFLEVGIDQAAKVLPKLSVNRPIEDQDPILPRDELKENMVI
ncbi:MAG: thiamine pyrophosphate-binding protein, partial [Candidatus Omnitrophota bacterium]